MVDTLTITPALPGQTTTSNASVNPFTGVIVTDSNPLATVDLVIRLSDTSGTLTGTGIYYLTGTAAEVTAQLQALSFTPNGSAGTTSTTTFKLSAFSDDGAYIPPYNATTVTNTYPGWKYPVSGSWNIANNWLAAPGASATPGANDPANIGGSGTYTVTSSQNNAAIGLNVLNSNATLAITGKSTLTLGNQASSNQGTIAVNEESALNIGAGTFSNRGTLKAVGGGNYLATIKGGVIVNYGTIAVDGVSNLVLANTTINNAGGVIQAQGSKAQFDADLAPVLSLKNVTIAGGTLSTGWISGATDVGDFWAYSNPTYWWMGMSTGFMATQIGTQNGLDGSASQLTNSALLVVNSSSTLTLKGEIINKGEIGLNTTNSVLQVSGDVRLGGHGVIATSKYGNGGTISAVGNATLTNIDNTIVSTKGTLTINSAITNGGTLSSAGGALKVAGAVTGTGTEQISSGTLEFGSSVSSGQQVQFRGAAADLLKLDHAESFAGTVAGFSAGDKIDLANFKYGSNTAITVDGSNARDAITRVTLVNNGLTATIQLLNQTAGQFSLNKTDYSLATDNVASPATAGTLFTLAAPSHA
jgi:hypothetical protein